MFGFELLDQRIGFVARESSSGLALIETQWPACVAEIFVPGGVDQLGETSNLLGRGGRACRLAEGHDAVCPVEPGGGDSIVQDRLKTEHVQSRVSGAPSLTDETDSVGTLRNAGRSTLPAEQSESRPCGLRLRR